MCFGSKPQRFEYKPLSRKKHQIRVLRLKNLESEGSSSGDIHCTIKTVTLKSKPSYRALSYTWGAPEPKFTIFVNDAPFQVSQNLYEFLKAFRGRPEAAEPIWIDQIAINQDDIPERNSQVSKMKNVYVSAKEVIMWLGPGSSEELRAVPLIQEIAQRLKQEKEANKLNPESLELLRAFANIPYFHRLWVVQEIILATTLQVLIGNQVLVWDDLYKVFSKHSDEMADGTSDMTEPIRSIERLGISRIDQRGIEPSITNIEDHISYFMAQKCVDPRDKIYGTVGMFFDPTPGLVQRFARRFRKKHGLWAHKDPLFEVDYAKSVEEVLFDFVENMLVRSPDAQQTFGILDDLADAMGLPQSTLYDWSEDPVRKDRIEALLDD